MQDDATRKWQRGSCLPGAGSQDCLIMRLDIMVEGSLVRLATAVGLTLTPGLTAMPFFFIFLPLLLLPLPCRQCCVLNGCMHAGGC